MQSLRPGFADPVRAAQSSFRAILDALSCPGTIQTLPAQLEPPPPFTPGLAAIALTLADAETPLWLDETLRAAPGTADWLRFHTGAPLVDDPGAAAFALVADSFHWPPFALFAQGTDDYPDRSTTIVLAVAALAAGEGLTLRGPGIRERAQLSIHPMPCDLAARLRDNRALFPRGVDLILAAPGAVAALPRSVEADS